jgi:hypothetical protein
MRLYVLIGIFAGSSTLAVTAGGQVVNFHDAFNAALFSVNYDAAHNFSSQVYTGQGAAPDAGDNDWNGFGGFTRATWPSAAITSAGSTSPLTLSVTYGFDTGGVYNYSDNVGHNLVQGLPEFLMGNAAAVDSTNPGAGTASAPMGTFVLNNVAPGTYTLYLYGADYDNDRGTTFALAPANGGSPAGGIASTLNDQSSPGVTLAFSQGANYVIFNNVQPDPTGNIAGTFIPNPADGVGNANLPGEADFNGLQLVAAPEPVAAALAFCGSALLIRRRSRPTSASPAENSGKKAKHRE